MRRAKGGAGGSSQGSAGAAHNHGGPHSPQLNEAEHANVLETVLDPCDEVRYVSEERTLIGDGTRDTLCHHHFASLTKVPSLPGFAILGSHRAE